jgi:hypothetical protein
MAATDGRTAERDRATRRSTTFLMTLNPEQLYGLPALCEWLRGWAWARFCRELDQVL